MTNAFDTIKEVRYTNGAVVSGRMIDTLAVIERIMPGSKAIQWRNGRGQEWKRSPRREPDEGGVEKAREIAGQPGG